MRAWSPSISIRSNPPTCAFPRAKKHKKTHHPNSPSRRNAPRCIVNATATTRHTLYPYHTTIRPSTHTHTQSSRLQTTSSGPIQQERRNKTPVQGPGPSSQARRRRTRQIERRQGFPPCLPQNTTSYKNRGGPNASIQTRFRQASVMTHRTRAPPPLTPPPAAAGGCSSFAKA